MDNYIGPEYEYLFKCPECGNDNLIEVRVKLSVAGSDTELCQFCTDCNLLQLDDRQLEWFDADDIFDIEYLH